MPGHAIPVWFFIGALFLVYGVLIFGVGIYQIFVPPVGTVVLANLHLTLWWGLAMTAIGLIYVIRFWPSRRR